MENRMERVERSLEYLICKVKKLSEMNEILEEKVRVLDGINNSKSKDLLSDSEKQAVTEHVAKFKPSNNQLRGEIIRKAKQFVSLKKGHFNRLHSFNFGLVLYNIDFKINKNKRTVEGLLITSEGFVRKRVKVTCHPDDVFNVDLGKAVAVGRLLGLDITEFEDAPQPDKFTVGQTIEWNLGDSKYNIVSIDCDKYSFYSHRFKENYKPTCYPDLYELAKIIDDTDAKYEFN